MVGVQPCGKNKLSSMVKSMFAMIGITGKTNHSLRATGASSLFQAGIPEKIIQKRTGHRPIKALRMYQCMTTSQYVAVSNILSSTKVNFPQATVGHLQNQLQMEAFQCLPVLQTV